MYESDITLFILKLSCLLVVRSVPRIFNLKRSLLGDNIKKENKRLTVVYLNIFMLVKKKCPEPVEQILKGILVYEVWHMS